MAPLKVLSEAVGGLVGRVDLVSRGACLSLVNSVAVWNWLSGVAVGLARESDGLGGPDGHGSDGEDELEFHLIL